MSSPPLAESLPSMSDASAGIRTSGPAGDRGVLRPADPPDALGVDGPAPEEPAAGPPSARERRRIARELAEHHGGVVHRAQLREHGITRLDVRTEFRAQRWTSGGRHTVVLGHRIATDVGRRWQAVWESGSGAALDGASALIAHGMTGFTPHVIDVAVQPVVRAHRLDGVRLRRYRRLAPRARLGIPRVAAAEATVHAAQWALSDRQAALLVCLGVQQGITCAEHLLAAWSQVGRSPRRRFLDGVIRDVCDGAHSLGELDVARVCRRYGLPEPSRQVVRELPSGRRYLALAWEEVGLVVEVDGAHHGQRLTPIDDALRQNEVTAGDATVLRIPVLGLRLQQDAFMRQVADTHRRLASTTALRSFKEGTSAPFE